MATSFSGGGSRKEPPTMGKQLVTIETGRWQKITRENRKCTKCSKDVIGDEYHYFFICNNTEIQRLRSKYIPNITCKIVV